MKRYIMQWKWIAAIMLSLFVNAHQIAQATPPINEWEVFLDSFNDYTSKYASTTTLCPLYPFWLTKYYSLATPSTLFLTKNTDTAVYPSIQTCLVIGSYDTCSEVLYYHLTRLANYSFQY